MIPAPDGPPGARDFHVAVHTGTHMLIWGGDDAYPSESDGYRPPAPHPLATGAAHDLATGRWAPLPKAPLAARSSPAAAWTGEQMLVWGGRGARAVMGDGAAYDPARARWRRMAKKGQPSPRVRMAFAWTGAKMLVFGGEDAEGTPLGDGRAYDPATDRWRRLASEGAPSPRARAQAVWTGTELLVWGGYDERGWLANGAILDLEAGSWRPIASAGAPAAEEPVVVWAGDRMLVWGGHASMDSDEPWIRAGSRYDPVADRWAPMGTVGATARSGARGLWTGEVLAVVGQPEPDDAGSYVLGLYYPARDRWWNVESYAFNLDGGSMIWTGTELVAWGGSDGTNMLPIGTRVRLPGR